MFLFAFPAACAISFGGGLIICGSGLVISGATRGYAPIGNPLPLILIGLMMVIPVLLGLPFIHGNARFAGWFARRSKGSPIIQLTLMPRRCAGLEGLIEGADDVGVLTLERDRLMYSGDAIKFSISRSAVVEMRARGLGWNGFFLLGDALDLKFAEPIDGVEGLSLAPRQDALLTVHRRSARRLKYLLQRWWGARRS